MSHKNRIICPRLRGGKAWCRASNADSRDTKIDGEAAKAAKMLLDTLTMDMAAVVWPFPGRMDEGRAYADAWAEESCGGLGGWFAAGPVRTPAEVWWYHVEVKHEDLPSSWRTGTLNSIIASLELLAQACLRACRSMSDCKGNLLQHSDNMGAVGVTAKRLTPAMPFAEALRLLARLVLARRCHLHVSHISGSRNEWADRKSRIKSTHKAFRYCLDPRRRVKIELRTSFSALG